VRRSLAGVSLLPAHVELTGRHVHELHLASASSALPL
jgi:hypothetical protein